MFPQIFMQRQNIGVFFVNCCEFLNIKYSNFVVVANHSTVFDETIPHSTSHISTHYSCRKGVVMVLISCEQGELYTNKGCCGRMRYPASAGHFQFKICCCGEVCIERGCSIEKRWYIRQFSQVLLVFPSKILEANISDVCRPSLKIKIQGL